MVTISKQIEKKEAAPLEPLDQLFAEVSENDPGMFPARISLAMSYVPNQPFEKLYDEATALCRGTLFQALDFPFVGGKAR